MNETEFAPHPGSIRMKEMYTGTERVVPISEVPEAQQFVWLKGGIETANKAEATERVPIVEVRMISIDERGNLVPKEEATQLVIHEFGPEGRALRHTTMVRNVK